MRRARSTAVVAAFVLGLMGCVQVHRTLPNGEVERVPRAELPAYAEAVFKRRNAVSTEFLVSTTELADVDAATGEQLDAAERQMDAACAPVDALAIAYRDGRKVSFSEKVELARALDGCAAATDAAEQALEAARGKASG